MSDTTKKVENEEEQYNSQLQQQQQSTTIGLSSQKKSIRFVGEQGVSEDQIPSGNTMKSVNTSRAVSDSTREDDEYIEDIVQETQSKFRHIKSIDIILPSGEEKLAEIASPSKRIDKSCNVSSVHSENQEDNLSVHFGGLELIDENDNNNIPKFEYEPDDIPLKSILKNDLNRSRNISFDVRMLKDIEGKMISHDNLSMNPDIENEEGDGSKNMILKDSQFNEDSISQGRSYCSGAINKSVDSSNGDFYDDDVEILSEPKIEYRNNLDSEVRFKLQPIIQETEKALDPNGVKRNSLLFPAYSILKNSPLVQPSEFKALKQIEKVSNHSHYNSAEYSMSKNIQLNSQNQSGEESEEDSQENEESDVRFVGDIVLQENNAYKFKYNPDENPKKPIIKRGSCIAHYAMTPTAAGSSQVSSFTPLNNFKQSELSKKKRMSYDFLSLKNVEGKVIKHWQPKFLEENNLNDGQDRDIKFGAIEFLETTSKLGDQAQIASKAIKPQKPILKPNRGRSNSLDFKKSIKNIDGVYIRKVEKEGVEESNEEEKVVHFGEVVQTEEPLNKGNKTISINLNLVRMSNSQQEQPNREEQKSILKRSSSVQMRIPPSFISNDNTPTAIKKSTFSSRKIEPKEHTKLEAPTQDTFTANWTSLRNDYIESAFKFLIRIDVKQVSSIFQHGMESKMFNQIIDVLHERTENEDAFVKSYIENLYKLKNFQTLLFANKHQQENIQDILDSLEINHAINHSTYNHLCSLYILKSTD